MATSLLPLSGQTALITGVSRRRGIGFATAARLAKMGANLCIQHFCQNDKLQPWGSDDIGKVVKELSTMLLPGSQLVDYSMDLRDPQSAKILMDKALQLSETVDILVCNQAQSGNDSSILSITANSLDEHWNANARSTILLTSEFAKTTRNFKNPGTQLKYIIWLTSGQGHSAMLGEVAYAASKAALSGLTRTVAAELLPLGIVLNTVNPGPVNTGYLDNGASFVDSASLENLLAKMPLHRFGEPDDPARLIEWLVSGSGRWIAGQVLTTDGGFSL